jgi:hypothetical protein
MNTKQQQIDEEARRVAEGGKADQQSQQQAETGHRRQGDNRTRDKPIGQVEYADNEGGGEQKKQGGSTKTSL